MALTGIFCSSCGLEILSDQKAIKPIGTNDWYHAGSLYNCYNYKDMKAFYDLR